jgi:sec-independent protein translocase protein TatB
MFGIGILELILIFVVAVIVLGPKQLPEAARTIGVWFYRLKDSAQSVQTDLEATFRNIDDKESKIEKSEKPPSDGEDAGK